MKDSTGTITLRLLVILATLFSPTSSTPIRTRSRCTAFSNIKQQLIAPQATFSASPSTLDLCSKFDAASSSSKRSRDSGPVSYHAFTLEETASSARSVELKQEVDLAQTMSPTTYPKPALRTEFLPTSTDLWQAQALAVHCVSDPVDQAEFHISATALCVLKIVVGMAFLACAIECISFLFRWLSKANHHERSQLQSNRNSTIQLFGSEKHLTALPSQSTPTPSDFLPMTPDRLFSPGLEKKQLYYAALALEKRAAAEAKRRDEDEDDELNWPVL